jgi:hypothetical protein
MIAIPASPRETQQTIILGGPEYQYPRIPNRAKFRYLDLERSTPKLPVSQGLILTIHESWLDEVTITVFMLRE